MSESSYLTQEQALEIVGDYTLKLSSTKMPPLYSLNESISFFLELRKNGLLLDEGKISYEFLWDMHDSVEKGELSLDGQVLEIPFKAEKPGFVQLDVIYESADGLVEKSCGAGFAVDQLKPSTEEPVDFHDFWAEQKRQLSEVAIEATHIEITKESHPHLHDYSHKALLEEDLSDVKLSYTSVACKGNSVEGVLTKPLMAKKKSHPVVLALHGAGVVPSQPHNFIHDAKKGAIVYEINAHGIPNDEIEAYYHDLIEGDLKDYSRRDFSCKEDFYFLGMFLRVKRALEFLKSLPEWDGKSLFVRGGSQGGAQTIAGAYLDQDVTGFIALVSGFCDHTAALIDRAPGWPSLVPLEKGQIYDRKKANILRYFDAVNFLKNSKAEGFFSVGYLDGTCKPTSIYVAYNSHQGPHEMVHQPYSAHSTLEETRDASNVFMWNHFDSLKK